ncbi:MAG: D-alanyl-D-alanine carboxypeptidase [Paracoccaceae bacterium]|nr:D-alanyl-D-alanine carboxypeptidase [Paracoccaceae bacterium]
MSRRQQKQYKLWLFIIATIWMVIILPLSAVAAPYAALVIDARTGKTLHSENADTRLHPASLTKMMTLYVVFEAIENGEISADKMIKISRKAASEPPSKLGLRAGQKIRLRYLIRAASVKSANDAATALGEAIEGTEAAFARRMNRTAKALGMTRTTFKNAHGLTETGHKSTARDMTTLGRHLFYDFPDYYHLFKRQSIDAGMKSVRNTNRRFLQNYRGADGIKTGFTNAAGFNLVASAKRGNERIIATVFGGRSTSTRNTQVAKLLSLGFKKAPSKVRESKPKKPNYANIDSSIAVGKIVRLKTAVDKNLRPKARPGSHSSSVVLASANLKSGISHALTLANTTGSTDQVSSADTQMDGLLSMLQNAPAVPEIVTRLSTSGGRDWAINVGRFPSRYAAEKMLLKTALAEMGTLEGSLRKVVVGKLGFEANFLGLSEASADRACRRLEARNVNCSTLGPG